VARTFGSSMRASPTSMISSRSSGMTPWVSMFIAARRAVPGPVPRRGTLTVHTRLNRSGSSDSGGYSRRRYRLARRRSRRIPQAGSTMVSSGVGCTQSTMARIRDEA